MGADQNRGQHSREMEIRPIVGKIVFVILLVIFLWKSAEAVHKYMKPGKGQKISVEDHEKIDFPTLAICPVLRDRDVRIVQNRTVDGLAGAYEKVPPVHDVFPIVHYLLKEEDVLSHRLNSVV